MSDQMHHHELPTLASSDRQSGDATRVQRPRGARRAAIRVDPFTHIEDLKMPTRATEHHASAAKHHDAAAHHHREAAKALDAGRPETAATHAQVAQGHSAHAEEATTEANKIEAAKAPAVGASKADGASRGDGAARGDGAIKTDGSVKQELAAKKS
jgi:hypothetical protein